MASATYLLLLSPDEKRGCRFVQLSASSVLEWFRRHWSANSDTNTDARVLRAVYGLGNLFDEIADQDIACPEDDGELMALLEKHIYYERDIVVEEHFIHIETDDDEVDIEYFIFDDTFLCSAEALDRLPAPPDDSHGFPEPSNDEDSDESYETGDLDYRAFLADLKDG